MTGSSTGKKKKVDVSQTRIYVKTKAQILKYDFWKLRAELVPLNNWNLKLTPPQQR